MIVIGITGIARSGKDTFASIALDIFKKSGITAKQYSFAGALKEEVKDFLKTHCDVDVYTQDSEIKKDIRDFLVWYGTTWWRNRDPKRWIRNVDMAIKNDIDNVEVALVSDVRYTNEAEWVHSCHGFLVHVAAYDPKSLPVKIFNVAPNEQERINDPLVKEQSDYKLEWPLKGLAPEDALNDLELKTEVLKALNSMSYLINPIDLKELHLDKN